jgi:parallel beta-helix repeat protein
MTSIFGGSQTVNVNVNGTLVPQSFTATAGQTVFNITNFSYTQNTNSLLVFINGDKQGSGKDFAETSSTSFTLTEACLGGETVEVIGFPQIDLTAVNAGAVNIGGTYSLAQYLNDSVINVKAYPYLAKGDGVADDTAAIQAAINSFAGNPGCVLFPIGEYKISESLVLKDFVALQGEAHIVSPGYYFKRGATIVGNFTGPLIKYEVSLALQPLENGFYISDLMLNGSNVCTSGIYLQRFRSVHLHRVVVKDCKDYGIWLDEQEAQSSNTAVIEDCYVNNSFIAAYRVCGQWAKIHRCISDGGFNSLILDKTASGATVTDCHFEAAYDVAIKITGGGGNKIANNNLFLYRYKIADGTHGTTPYPAQARQVGILIDATSGGWYNQISGNQIRYSTDGLSPSAPSTNIRGISVTNNISHINVITGNVIYGVEYGVWLSGDKNTLQGNSISSGKAGIYIESNSNTISGGFIEIYPPAAGTYCVVRASGSLNTVYGISTSEPFYNISPTGHLTSTGILVTAAPLTLINYTVATLPSAASSVYSRAFVSDATVTSAGTVVAGGGSNKVPVYSDGTNWRIG